MSEQEMKRPYGLVRDIVEAAGGKMSWQPMGAGGDWLLELHGRRALVPCRDRSVNALDRLYVPKAGIGNPSTWADYPEPAALKPDAFWRLVGLFESSSDLGD